MKKQINEEDMKVIREFLKEMEEYKEREKEKYKFIESWANMYVMLIDD